MKVLALNSSPRGEGQSKTEMILTPLVAGMREAGAQVEVINLRQKTVRNCIGCYTCWTKTPGVCIHKDDMTQELFPKWLKADMAVYATPLYHFTMNASIKAFIERTLPVLEPFFVRIKDRTTHPLRHKVPKVVVVSVAGFPEMPVFDQLSSYVRFLFGRGLLAEIYRPGAESLAPMPFPTKREEIFTALRGAGRELVQSQKVSDETLARITQPLGTESVFAKIGDLMWKTCIAEKITPKEMAERGIVPRPDSIETFMIILPMGFRPDKAGNLKATVQFDFSGGVAGSCHFVIGDGQILAIAGPADNPDLTIETPFDLWMDIITGKRDGQQAFMAQAYNTKGDLSLLIRVGELFGKQS
jgi:multimeric flavodoxin WrbA